MAGLVDTFCLGALPKTSVDFLTGLTEEYRIGLDDTKKEDHGYLVKMVVKHLTSDAVLNSADKGAAIFLKLYTELGEELKKGGVKVEPVGEPDRSDELTDTLSYHKLRQFKINGTIGDPGQKGCVTYSSLCYQIRQGEKLHYTTSEIYAGVIRAIEPGNPFRDVLELEADDFDKASFMKSLRSHFQIRDPNAVLYELRKCVQKSDETAHKFVCRCVALKKKVKNMCASEEIPFDLASVDSTFFRTIYTGLRQTNVRNELRQTLLDAAIADDDLLLEVSEAQANETERLRKLEEMKGKPEKSVNVKQITFDSDSDEAEGGDNSSSSAFSQSDSNSSGGRASGGQKSRGRKKNPSQNPQSRTQVPNQNKQPNQNAPRADTSSISSSDFAKMTAALNDVTASNAKLTAEVNVLKQMRNKQSDNSGSRSQNPSGPRVQNNPPGPRFQNPTTAPVADGNVPPGQYVAPVLSAHAPPFTRPQQNFNRNGRPTFRCQICMAYNIPYCIHCLKCGSDDGHKAKDCLN